jgi:2-methylisocitrate lyase-like PEP mutase family enzyme
MVKKSTRFRNLLKSGDLLITIAVGTAQQAQLAEKLGFELVGISGAITSTTILGLPDAGFLTLTELVENTERICNAVDIPVRVDCDTGFGNAINVRRTVASIIRSGAAGLFIEDQMAPKRCGFVKGKELISVEEATGKYRAAIDVRDELDPDFVIMARTDARGAVGGSLEEAIRRGRAYLDAGVDILYVEALQSRDEIKQVRDTLKDCWLYCSTQAITPPLTQKEMQDLGLCMASCFISHIGLMAMYDFLVNIKEQGLDYYAESMEKNRNHPMGGFRAFDLAGFPEVVEWEKKYLSPDKMDKYDSSIGVYDPRAGQQRK